MCKQYLVPSPVEARASPKENELRETPLVEPSLSLLTIVVDVSTRRVRVSSECVHDSLYIAQSLGMQSR